MNMNYKPSEDNSVTDNYYDRSTMGSGSSRLFDTYPISET